jgi:hypothetical protein
MEYGGDRSNQRSDRLDLRLGSVSGAEVGVPTSVKLTN